VGLRGGDDRRHKVGHDDRTRVVRRGVRKNGVQNRAVAKVEMPVIGTANGQGRHSCLFRNSWTMSVAAMKSDNSIASCGLCEPLLLRTKTIPEGTPAAAKTA